MIEGQGEPSIDYSLKYRPLCTCLDADDDYLCLEQYGEDIVNHFRTARRKALQSYALSLQTDFDNLYRAARATALADESLARRLAAARANLRKVQRYIRYFLFLDALLPPFSRPRAKLQRAALHLRSAELSSLLLAMDGVRIRLTDALGDRS
jgi:hypothetical protein